MNIHECSWTFMNVHETFMNVHERSWNIHERSFSLILPPTFMNVHEHSWTFIETGPPHISDIRIILGLSFQI